LPGPNVLRFDPAVAHPRSKQEFPALIAMVSGAAEPSFNVTFLAADGGGKAAIDKKDQRRTYGSNKGGAVQLAASLDDKPLLLGEGIETTLTAMEATGWPGWALLGTSGFKNYTWSGRGRMVMLGENDDKGANQKALCSALSAPGREGF
jgi:hypothetical protein